MKVGYTIENMSNLVATMPKEIHGGLKLRHLSEEDVSKILKISRPTLRNWKREGKVKFYQIGKATSPCLYEPKHVRMAIDLRIKEIREKAEKKVQEIEQLADDMIPQEDTD